ncbi:hypothetical protein L4174_000455 [Photobacterium sp. CCB-ST2H9]|uniref:hypothetical protein n=1 Tax=Photobacterium sp. CCB-ST2H9 TaxID=2912855 RepID=UPI002003E175|nr:hypothetical protein [Photobacterium sp. CCB-ST2H9]UTM57402.1 hypothetical protein L4174_000455 [Photobacterium sp. CCB-ST2H9]
MKVKSLLVIAFSAFCSVAHAEISEPQLIQQVGCDQESQQCALSFGVEKVGPAECASNKINWSSETTQGKLAVALLSSAMMTQHQVAVAVDSVCGTNGLPQLKSYEVLAKSKNVGA